MGEAPPSRERHGPAWLVHTIIMNMNGNARETGLDMVHERSLSGERSGASSRDVFFSLSAWHMGGHARPAVMSCPVLSWTPDS